MTETEKKPISKSIKMGVTAAACAGLLAAGGAFAYFTDSASVENWFHVNNSKNAVNVEPVESQWNADDATNVAPLQTLAKDPKVANVGELPVYAMIQVGMPLFTGDVTGADGAIEEVADADLFTYEVNEGWTQFGEPVMKDGKRVYTYLHADPVPAKGESAALFDSVTMINLANTVEDIDDSIDVECFGNQAEGFESAEDAWAAYQKQHPDQF